MEQNEVIAAVILLGIFFIFLFLMSTSLMLCQALTRLQVHSPK